MIKTPFHPFPEIKTQRLILRRIEMSDAPEMFQMRGNSENNEYLLRPLAASIEEMPDFIQKIIDLEEQRNAINWCMCFGSRQPMIGNICIWNLEPDNHRGELGYSLLKSYRSQGFMTEAIQAVINFGFNEMNLHAISARVHAQNLPSFKILEKIGFLREAYFRDRIFYNEQYHDEMVYTLINPSSALK